jgi:2-polyprenyl-3-methyl-5-hydroxy-6-metoxy-1,4-benzoquinol methylase
MDITGTIIVEPDCSRLSIKYARQVAREIDLDIVYRYQDYLILEDAGQHDIVVRSSMDIAHAGELRENGLRNH